MSAATLLGIGLLGGLGACARFLVDVALTTRLGRGFPYGTLAVNLSGAFALGILVGATAGTRLVGTGFIGAYTTFSTWMVETHRLSRRLAALNVVGSLVLGLALAWLGREMGMVAAQ